MATPSINRFPSTLRTFHLTVPVPCSLVPLVLTTAMSSSLPFHTPASSQTVIPPSPICTMQLTLHHLYSCIRLFLASITHFLTPFLSDTIWWVQPTQSLEDTISRAKVMKKRANRLSTTIRSYRVTIDQTRMLKPLVRLLGELLSCAVDLHHITWHLAKDVVAGNYKAAGSSFPILRQGHAQLAQYLPPPPLPAANTTLTLIYFPL
eukprot:jgi/Psemu1/61378/gm1.61378_g